MARKRETSRNFASQKLLEIVGENKIHARSAERDFDRANDRIQLMTRRNINLYGGTVTREVASIVYAAREACDELYSAYQSLVQDTDRRCKQYLNDKPDAESIAEVRDFIEWLNDESAIENNFSASLNYVDYGDVASVKYSATIENRMIQKEWERRYESHPEIKELRKKQTEEAKKRAALAKAAEEKRRKEEEKRRAEEEKRQKKIKEKHDEWEIEKNRIIQFRNTLVNQSALQREMELKKEMTDKKNDAIARQEIIMDAMNQSINEAKEKLNSLGMFKFSEKKYWKKEISICEIAIANSVKTIEDIKQEYETEITMIPEIIESYRKDEAERITSENPIPKEPEKPNMNAVIPSNSVVSRSAMLNTQLMELIYDRMAPGEKYKVSEIYNMIPELQEYSINKVSALVRGLKLDGRLSRSESRGLAYYEKV